MELIRYADEGFKSYQQDKGDIVINGCHCFAGVEDKYMFSGIASHRPVQTKNIIEVNDDLLVWTRNIYYHVGTNEYGYPSLCCDTWDEESPSWIQVPIWWVKENIKVIVGFEGSCVGYFATDVIYEPK